MSSGNAKVCIVPPVPAQSFTLTWRVSDTFNPIHRVSRMFFVAACRSSHVGDFESSFLRRKCVGSWHRDQSDFVQLVTSANDQARCHAILVHALHFFQTRIKNRMRYRLFVFETRAASAIILELTREIRFSRTLESCLACSQFDWRLVAEANSDFSRFKN